jgi:putative oxygen-independent coproporphyrinogen III oxidase
MIEKSFGLYIHWPFCVSKCPYCDFNSHVRASIDEHAWRQSLQTELKYVGNQTQGRKLTSVFFGGGTPSLMSPQTVESLLNDLSRYWQLDPQLEITLEANPNSVDAAKFQDFKRAGINRLSLGIQSLNDPDLKFLGRSHGRLEAIKAIEVTAQIFDRFSFDLIYARPQQKPLNWKNELKEALTYAQGHLSLYQLTIEPGTAFQTAFNRGDWEIPNEISAANLYELTAEMLSHHGYDAYEISNYARPGNESHHNLTYWRYEDFAGIGPGAHGRLTLDGKRYATKCLRAPETWLKSVQEQGHGVESTEQLDIEIQLEEMILMGLRLKEGILLSRLENLYQKPFQKIFNMKNFEQLEQALILEVTPSHIKATTQGRLVLNYLINKLSQAMQ